MTRPLVIAGHASGVGKTTIATGLMGAFRSMGLKVAPFKVGPDYIDPGYHRQAAGAPSRNLDTWLTSPEAVRSIYQRGAAVADVSVVEGVMGLFDGRAGGRDQGSTAEVARLIGGAVVLVVNCASLARSLAPLLYGFDKFDESLGLAGVILNNVGSTAHGRMLRDAAAEAGVPVLGEIPRTAGISLKSRHLGLVPPAECDDSREKLEETVELVKNHVDLEALLAIAGTSVCHSEERSDEGSEILRTRFARAQDDKKMARIAIAWDEAFSFYYVDSLEALEAEGAELVYFSPLRDGELPGCDGLYLGGGFPEMFAGELEANTSMRRSILQAVQGGLPVYAECGGLVYLCRGVEVEGVRRQMVGAIKSEAMMTGRRQALGYVEAKARRRNLLMEAGSAIRGHQFHWSKVEWQSEHLAYDCFSSKRPEVEPDGYCQDNLLATYVHVNFAGDDGAAAKRFVGACVRAKEVGAGVV